MSELLLDFAQTDTSAGFRLHRLEVLNWGTFHGHVHSLQPKGANSLLTGDIGSGKSTLVDAITTLLVPHNRIVYNKAAGAVGKERNLASYIRGEYKTEQDDLTRSAKPVSLREPGTLTVLLGHFQNEGFRQDVTLAQVLWLREGEKNPHRFFVVAESTLAIADHFTGFGNRTRDLRRKLKEAGCEIFDQFSRYEARFRHLFGLKNPKALELFHQTVSLKSVGNLTDFVRNHMLEAGEAPSRIDELRRRFDDLNRSHEAVIRAKRQIGELHPIAEDAKLLGGEETGTDHLKICRDFLPAYTAGLRTELIEAAMEELEETLTDQDGRLETMARERETLQTQVEATHWALMEKGGKRLTEIASEIRRLETERKRKEGLAKRYTDAATKLALLMPETEEAFSRNRKEAETRTRELEAAADAVRNRQVEAGVELRQLKTRHEALEEEIRSLSLRKSNIPRRTAEIRSRMAQDLGLSETDLPFVGELIRVKETESAWEGAIERVLFGFGMSLLVAPEQYAEVSDWVDRQHLGIRLVYYRTGRPARIHPANDYLERLSDKLAIREDSPFAEWVTAELKRRCPHVCCASPQEFRQHNIAITKSGQIRNTGGRHEKDDRHDIRDRSRYILGWASGEKVRVLEEQQAKIAVKSQDLAAAFSDNKMKETDLVGLRDAAQILLGFSVFHDMDPGTPTRKIAALTEEKTEIESRSDALKVLETKITSLKADIRNLEEDRDRLLGDRARNAQQMEDLTAARTDAISIREEADPEKLAIVEPRIAERREEMFFGHLHRLSTLDREEGEIRKHFQAEIDEIERRIRRLGEGLIQRMQIFRASYPAETIELDADLAALPAWMQYLERLEGEDLPRHERRFREMLTAETIQSVALFRSQLEQEASEIRKKINAINTSLKEIPYNEGTYISIVAEPAADTDIREFRQDLAKCLSSGGDGDDIYNEEKFLQVKAIIERFQGREGISEQDQKWTRKVTDTRNWFSFAASERFDADDMEKEFYSDSSGKSGGQKEKLAYTILASALAFQFGLEWGETRSRSFRFVVIDEAFGKGSDESTRYALELFNRLHLQLLIATPLQKIRVIEDYIRTVHYVTNKGGERSRLRELDVETYRSEREKFQTETDAEPVA